MIHTIIHGFILYQIEIRCSNDSIIVNKNQSTKIREPIVQIMSTILLSHWYMKVHIIVMARIIAITKGISFVSCPKIVKNLRIT